MSDDLVELARRLNIGQDDENFYAIVAFELEAGRIRTGLWTKALAQTDMNPAPARARYIILRVEQLRSRSKVLPAQLLALLANEREFSTQQSLVADLAKAHKDLRSEVDELRDQWSEVDRSVVALQERTRPPFVALALGCVLGSAAALVIAILILLRSASWSPSARIFQAISWAMVGAGCGVGVVTVAHGRKAGLHSLRHELVTEVGRREGLLSSYYHLCEKLRPIGWQLEEAHATLQTRLAERDGLVASVRQALE